LLLLAIAGFVAMSSRATASSLSHSSSSTSTPSRARDLGPMTFVSARTQGNCRLDGGCFHSCDEGYSSLAEDSRTACMELCCPTKVTPGTCFEWGGDQGWGCGCPAGFNEVAVGQKVLFAKCPPSLCCSPGGIPAFWYQKCFEDCPAGFTSVLKPRTGGCWDLCVPTGTPSPANPARNISKDDIDHGYFVLGEHEETILQPLRYPVHPSGFKWHGL